MEFKANLLKDQKIRLDEESINCEIININDLKKITEEKYALYPTVGENLDYLNSNNIEMINLSEKSLLASRMKTIQIGAF